MLEHFNLKKKEKPTDSNTPKLTKSEEFRLDLFFWLQTFVIVGGNIKLIPLTGVTLPFISYGGTSLVSSLCLVGVLQGISARTQAKLRPPKAEKGTKPAPRRKGGKR